MAQEKRFAKKNNMRQTISSGRFGFMKGDSYDRDFNVDNKQTMAWGFTLDIREWMDFWKRARMARRIAVFQVEFTKQDPPVSVIIMPYEDWLGMKEQLERQRVQLDERSRTDGPTNAVGRRRGSDVRTERGAYKAPDVERGTRSKR
jgi:hypothetical protein